MMNKKMRGWCTLASASCYFISQTLPVVVDIYLSTNAYVSSHVLLSYLVVVSLANDNLSLADRVRDRGIHICTHRQ